MNLNEFWALLEPGKNAEQPEENLKAALEKLAPEEIASFQQHFDNLVDNAYQWNLWGAAYLIHGGCSDDGFIDFRYSLISKGKMVYENALTDPDSLSVLGPDLEMENEVFGYVAGQVFEQKTEGEIPRGDSTAPDDPAGKEWDFDDDTENKSRLRSCTRYINNSAWRGTGGVPVPSQVLVTALDLIVV